MQSSPCCLLSRLPKPTPWFIALLADITQVACAVRLEAPLWAPPLSEPPLSPHDECVPSAFASTAAVAARFERKGRGREFPHPFPFRRALTIEGTAAPVGFGALRDPWLCPSPRTRRDSFRGSFRIPRLSGSRAISCASTGSA